MLSPTHIVDKDWNEGESRVCESRESIIRQLQQMINKQLQVPKSAFEYNGYSYGLPGKEHPNAWKNREHMSEKPNRKNVKKRKHSTEDKPNNDAVKEYLNEHPELIRKYIEDYLIYNIDLKQTILNYVKDNNGILSKGVFEEYLRQHLRIEWVKMDAETGMGWGSNTRYGIGIYLDDDLISKTTMGLYM